MVNFGVGGDITQNLMGSKVDQDPSFDFFFRKIQAADRQKEFDTLSLHTFSLS